LNVSDHPLLTVSDLCVDIPVGGGMLHAVRGVNFTVAHGETLGIVGESGSGKSMTALALMSLLPRHTIRRAERLQLGETDLRALPERELARAIRGNRITMIFQEPMTSLNPVYTIGRQLTEAMMLHRNATQAQATDRAVGLLERVGITAAASRLGQYPHQLSGGQRQRVMIAMALMNEPELIIADEPTSALDTTIQAQILHLLAELQRELRMALILISHDLRVIARVADTIAVMYAGEVIEYGSGRALLSAPQHPYTRGLLACIPDVERGTPGTRLGSISGVAPSLIGKRQGCVFASRCAYVQHECLTHAPPMVAATPEHRYRCVLPVGWDTNAVTLQHSASVQAGDDAVELTPGSPQTPARSSDLLAVRNVSCTFTVQRGLFARKQPLAAVRDASLELARGDVLALVGESGSGKSTLARIMLGLQPPDAGQVLLAQRAIGDYDPMTRARMIQPIFQDPYASLNPRQTVREIIRRPLDIHAVDGAAEREQRVTEMLQLVGLPKRLLHAYPNQMSGGQRQRVAIARAIVLQPNVVICDEPTSALDVSVQSQILNLLLDLRDRLGLAYVLITHNLAVVRHAASRVAVMYLGRIVETAETETLFNAPRHPYTQALLQSTMSLKPGAGIPQIGIGLSFPNPLDVPSGCAFHPRCPLAADICRTTMPPTLADRAGAVACHFAPSEEAPPQHACATAEQTQSFTVQIRD
jgi:peptide/nickel transport system ATP-binding protein